MSAQNYLFERITILFRNFAIGSDVSGDVKNVTVRDSVIGDDLGSSPWAIKIKTDSQEGGLVDGVVFSNVKIGNITYCGSSKQVFTPPHSARNKCSPKMEGANMIDINMGYVGSPTNPGQVRNIVFENLHGIGPTGSLMSASGLNASEKIVNLTLHNVSLASGNSWSCRYVNGFKADGVRPWPPSSTCKPE